MIFTIYFHLYYDGLLQYQVQWLLCFPALWANYLYSQSRLRNLCHFPRVDQIVVFCKSNYGHIRSGYYAHIVFAEQTLLNYLGLLFPVMDGWQPAAYFDGFLFFFCFLRAFFYNWQYNAGLISHPFIVCFVCCYVQYTQKSEASKRNYGLCSRFINYLPSNGPDILITMNCKNI